MVWKINSKLYLCIYGINDVRTIDYEKFDDLKGCHLCDQDEAEPDLLDAFQYILNYWFQLKIFDAFSSQISRTADVLDVYVVILEE